MWMSIFKVLYRIILIGQLLSHPLTPSPAKLPRPRAKLQLPSLLFRSLRCWSIEAISSDLPQVVQWCSQQFGHRFRHEKKNKFSCILNDILQCCSTMEKDQQQTNYLVRWYWGVSTESKCSKKFAYVMQSDAHGCDEMARSWFACFFAATVTHLPLVDSCKFLAVAAGMPRGSFRRS